MYVQKTINKPAYEELVNQFDGRLEKISSTQYETVYKSHVYLRFNIRIESQLSFSARVLLKKNKLNSTVIVETGSFKLVFAAALMFALISTVFYWIQPSFWAFAFGLVAGGIAYGMLYYQLKFALENYMRKLVGRQALTGNNF